MLEQVIARALAPRELDAVVKAADGAVAHGDVGAVGGPDARPQPGLEGLDHMAVQVEDHVVGLDADVAGHGILQAVDARRGDGVRRAGDVGAKGGFVGVCRGRNGQSQGKAYGPDGRSHGFAPCVVGSNSAIDYVDAPPRGNERSHSPPSPYSPTRQSGLDFHP